MSDIVREPTPLRDEFEQALYEGASAWLREVGEVGPGGLLAFGEKAFFALIDAGLPLVHDEPLSIPRSAAGRRALADVIQRSLASTG